METKSFQEAVLDEFAKDISFNLSRSQLSVYMDDLNKGKESIPPVHRIEFMEYLLAMYIWVSSEQSKKQKIQIEKVIQDLEKSSATPGEIRNMRERLSYLEGSDSALSKIITLIPAINPKESQPKQNPTVVNQIASVIHILWKLSNHSLVSKLIQILIALGLLYTGFSLQDLQNKIKKHDLVSDKYIENLKVKTIPNKKAP